MSTWERERKKNNTKRSGLRTSKLQRHIFLYLTQEKIAVVLTPTLHRQHKYLMECENFYPCTRCAASLISVVIIASRLLLLFFFFTLYEKILEEGRGDLEKKSSQMMKSIIVKIIRIYLIRSTPVIWQNKSDPQPSQNCIILLLLIPPEKFIFFNRQNYRRVN